MSEEITQPCCPNGTPERQVTVPPSAIGKLWNLTGALLAFAGDGFGLVTKEQYAARLTICNDCPNRAETRCMICGCYLPVKTKARAWTCPENKWPPIEEEKR